MKILGITRQYTVAIQVLFFTISVLFVNGTTEVPTSQPTTALSREEEEALAAIVAVVIILCVVCGAIGYYTWYINRGQRADAFIAAPKAYPPVSGKPNRV
jgi:hypothetical protein